MKITNLYRALHDYFADQINPFQDGHFTEKARRLLFTQNGRRLAIQSLKRRLLMGVVSSVFMQLGETAWVDIQPPNNQSLPSGTTGTWTLTNSSGYVVIASSSATVLVNTISALVTPPNAGVFFVNFTIISNSEVIKYSVQIQVNS